MRQGAAYQLLSYLGLINDFLVFNETMIHVVARSSKHIAFWVIFHAFLSSADLFQN